MNPPSPLTQRLLACLERFRGEEDGAIGREDWAGLTDIFSRECAVVSHLARTTGQAPDAATVERVRGVQERLRLLEETLVRQHTAMREEHEAIRRATRTRRAVKHTYGRGERSAA